MPDRRFRGPTVAPARHVGGPIDRLKRLGQIDYPPIAMWAEMSEAMRYANLIAVTARWCGRWREYTAPAVAFLVALMWLPWGAALVIALPVAATAGWFHGDPTRHRFNRRSQHAFLSCGISPMPKLIGKPRIADHVISAVYATSPGTDPLRLERASRRLQTVYRAPCKLVQRTDGTSKLRIDLKDLLAEDHPFSSAACTPDRVLMGKDRDGLAFEVPLLGHAWLIGGVRGSGKSAALSALIARIITMPHVELYIVDPKRGSDFAAWWPFATEVAVEHVDCIALMRRLASELDARQDALTEAGIESLEDVGPSARFPMRVLLIDELADFTRQKELRDQVVPLLSAYIAKGRSSGDVLVCATQHPSTAVIPTVISGQFTQRFGLRCSISRATNVIHGEGALGDHCNLSHISPKHPGRCWHQAGEFTEVVLFGLWGDRKKAEVERLSTLRSAGLGVVTPAKTPSNASQGKLEPPQGNSEPSDSAHNGSSDGSSPSTEGGSAALPPRRRLRKGEAAPLIRQALVSVNGSGLTIKELSEATGIPQDTIRDNIGPSDDAPVPVVKLTNYRYKLKVGS
jgi:hypothetical protein